MKTLFITVYDGAISKNILRTAIFPMLKERYRIVLFVPPKKHTYYVERFASDRVIVESTPPPERPSFEAKFQSLALDLFHTRTVRIKISNAYAARGNFIKMLFKLALWHIGGFKAVHRLVRKFYELTPDRSFDRYFDRYTPDAVFVPNMMSNDDYRMIKTARRRGVRSIGMPKSWDNFTTKTFFNVFPDVMLVQSELMKEGALMLFGYPKDRITVVGFPQFDVYNDRSILMSREEFCESLGLDPQKKIILYSGSGNILAPYDEEVLAGLIESVSTHPGLMGQSQILVRPHPKYEFDRSRIPLKEYVVIDMPGRLAAEKKSSWEFEDDDIRHLANSLAHMDVLVSTASTLNLEGAIFDKPLVSIAFDGANAQPFALSTQRYYEYEHLLPLVESKGMAIAYSGAELADQVAAYLVDREKDAEGRKKIVDRVVWRADGRAAERVGEAIIRYVEA